MMGFDHAKLAPVQPARQVQAAVKNDLSMDSVRQALKAKLAEELRLEVAEIEDDTPFVDLGLDSITGVTWVRKINELFGTRIEATKIYGHPTISKLGDLVLESAGRMAGQPAPAIASAPSPAPAPDSTRPAVGPSLSEVAATLRKLLAAELRISVEEIDEEAQFVDLGLDSITGVTWIKDINQRFGTALEATKVYSYPTLSRLGNFLHAEMTKAPAALAEPSPSPLQMAAPTPLPQASPKLPLRRKRVSWWKKKAPCHALRGCIAARHRRDLGHPSRRSYRRSGGRLRVPPQFRSGFAVHRTHRRRVANRILFDEL
jgi:acyl carrier protein